MTRWSLLVALVLTSACDKKKPDSEEPTTGAIAESAEGSEPIVEDPGETPAEDGATTPPPGSDDLQYEGTVAVVGSDIPCQTDADCVPASCCHPSACVAPKDAPNCADTMCTLECASGTMDCFGGCGCGEDKKCAAKIWTASGG